MKHSGFHQAIVAITMMLIGWLPSLAHDFEVDGVFYNKTSDNTVAVTYKGDYSLSSLYEYEGNIVIPSSVNYEGITYSVTSIGDEAFRSCSGLTSIQIPNSVTSIESEAFSGCTSLTSIEIPNSVTRIRYEAFWGCSNLTSIEIGNSVTSIEHEAFSGCTSLTSIEIPNSVTRIGLGVFRDCENLTSIVIPDSVTSIGNDAFYKCESLTSIEIPNSVTSIGSRAFCYCSSLTSIQIPNSVTWIGHDAFYKCESLTSIQIPNSVTWIGSYSFSNCSSLTSVVIGNSVTSIGDNAFCYCYDLTSIEIGNSVTSIGDDAFDYCESLTKITCLATNPPTIESYTFSNYSAELYVPAGCISAYQSANHWKKFNIKEIPTPSTSIALTQTTATLKATETITLIATILPKNATDKSVEWSSSDETVAVVDENGVVTAIAVGEAIITATTADGSNLTASCKVTVVPTLVETITLDKTEISLEATETATLIAIVLPELATDKSVKWSSSDETVAIVDENGVVTAIALGEAIITVTTVDGSNLSASCKVTVVPTLAESITLDKTEISLEATETATLVATVLPELTTNKSVIWTSSNEAVATVDANGKVTAVAVGEATITATTTDGSNLSASCKVTVVPTLAESIALDKTEISLEATETATLIATVLPELTTNKSVTWKSSNEAVATVDTNGKVTAVAVGEAIITATTADGSNKSATCKITVAKTLASSISLDKTSATLKATETLTLKATVAPATTTDKSVTWKSSNEAVATVDANGKVTAIAVGEATITATTADGSNKSATCKITVAKTLAESVALDKTTATLKATETLTLKATVAPATTTDKSVTWKSSNEAVATVDANGKVTAVAVGEATITATTTDGSNKSATCKVIVVPTLATYIILDKTEYEMVEKSDFQLTATILPELTTNKGVVWSSSDMWIASVDENGLVRAYSVGEAIITATTTDGSNLSASCKVTVVSSLAQYITLDKTEVSLKATETATLVATVLPETTSNKGVKWTSSDESVAIVSKKGVVTAIAVGEAVITAITIDGTDLSASCKVTVVPTLAESITLDKTEISLEATETATLIATFLPELTTYKSVTWKSSNEAVATVDANGKVTAVAVGEATITATTTDGSNKSATCKITVAKTLATSISLDKTSATLKATETLTLKATIAPTTTTDKSVTWKSSNEAVATVDANGKVTAVAVGEATITATTADGSNKSATCKITVAKTLASSISLDKTSATREATEILTLKATVAPATTTDKSVTWKSSNEAVATVDANGLVTAIAVGEATITATTADGSNKSATCKITVAKTLASSISLDKTSATLKATETLTLKATVAPATTTDKSVTWKSSNEAVATVDANGKVTAVAVGEATITATTADGSNKSATCKVIVVPTHATSITLDYTEYEMAEKSDFQLVATILPELATNKGVVWSSSDMWIASVDENGLVRAYSVGEAVITATTIDGSNLSASCKVTVVSSLAQSITLDKTEVSLEVTETAALVATVLPKLATDKSVKWSSSNESVSVVDNNGVVTAISIGEAVITATTVDGSNLSASCKVTVIPTLAVSIELDQTEASVEEKSEFQLTATILPKHTTNKEVAWSSSKKVIATVDDIGLVFVKSVGEVVITATTTDGSNLSASCYINVYSSDIDGVEGDDLIVATIGDNIVVKNAKVDSIVRVYAADGSIISSEVTTDGDVVVEAPIKGVYIVSVNGKTFKVMVK